MHFVATVAPLTKKARFLRKLCALTKADGKQMDMDFFLETIRRYTDATTITKRSVS
jgi:site-specific DNA recombinase